MFLRKWVFIGWIAVVATPPACLAQAPINTLSPAETRAGWVLLFDGVNKDANWRVGMTGTTNNWVVDSNTLANPPTGSGNELFTRQSYSNFEYTLEWRLNFAGNSGIFFRANPPSRMCTSSEWAILDDDNGADRTALGYMPGETTWPIKQTGDCYDLYPTTLNGSGSPYVRASRPYNQWNRGVLWANGNFIENWLNGQKVVDYELGTPTWQQRFQLSKYYNLCPAERTTWARHPSGLIGMQDHGGGLRVWFRNIKIRTFTPGEKLVSPLIAPNGGNFSGSVKVALEAAITGSVIRYTLDGSDPTASSPIYVDTLTLSATTTVRARTFRALFQTSDASAATFTRSGTALRDDLSPAPEVVFARAGRDLLIRNRSGQSFTAEVFSLTGSRAAAATFDAGVREIAFQHLRPGLYVVKMRRGTWTHSRKIALP